MKKKKDIYADGFLHAGGLFHGSAPRTTFPPLTTGGSSALVTPVHSPSGGGGTIIGGTYVPPLTTGGSGLTVTPQLQPSGGGTLGAPTLVRPTRGTGWVVPIIPNLGNTIVTSPDGTIISTPNTGGIVTTPSGGGGGGGGSVGDAPQDVPVAPDVVGTGADVSGMGNVIVEDEPQPFIDEDDYGINSGFENLFNTDAQSQDKKEEKMNDVGTASAVSIVKRETTEEKPMLTIEQGVMIVVSVSLAVIALKLLLKK
jgi:hypothetical protein